MKESVLVSIIVPCYNYGHFLAETLTSVKNQTILNWECIIIDNGSTDNTKEVVKEFIEGDNRFLYIYSENKGVSAARNLGIRNANGKYILPLDADDKIGENYLKDGIAVLENKPDIKVVYCDVELFGEVNRKWVLPNHTLRQLLIENTIFCSGIYRKADFEKTTGYDDTMLEGLEDWDFWITLLGMGGEVFKLPAVHFYYRIRKSSRNNSLKTESIKKIRNYIYSKHKTLFDKTFTIPDLLFELSESERRMDELKGSREYKSSQLLLGPFRTIQALIKRR
jgi:glycosyltransferase involved in cell wall biosynthesis